MKNKKQKKISKQSLKKNDVKIACKLTSKQLEELNHLENQFDKLKLFLGTAKDEYLVKELSFLTSKGQLEQQYLQKIKDFAKDLDLSLEEWQYQASTKEFLKKTA